MTNTPTPLDPIAQLVAKYQSNGHLTLPTPQQPAPQAPQKKGWTGFADKTLWDWLNLLGVFLIPIVIPAALFWLSIQQNATSLEVSKNQHENDQAIALDQQRATTLKAFMDDMTELLLHEGLRESKEGASVRVIARAKTLVALTQLDGERKGTLLRFLYEAQLIGYQRPQQEESAGSPEIDTIIDLASANLSGANLYKVTLYKAVLCNVDLDKADLSGANLSGADLRGTNLSKANLSKADLSGTDLGKISLGLNEADLSGANLSGAYLYRAYFWGILRIVAKVTPEQLAKAYTLKDATLPDGSHYPSTSYPIPHHQEPTN